MLDNTPINLRARKKSLLYSADLSAATDEIPHRVARYFAKCLCEKLERTEDIEVCDKLFGSKIMADDRSETTCGIHMGLGPTWVLLCLINGFAAWKAGAEKNSYVIQGDDLLGLWTPKMIRVYERTLTRLGLVINKSKSFIGKAGVFCERLAVADDGLLAYVRDVGHLAEVTAAKSVGLRSRNKLAAADGLCEVSYLPQIRNQTLRRLLPKRLGPGKVKHGGGGYGALTNTGLVELLRQKPMLSSGPRLPKLLTDELELNASNLRQKNDISVKDATIALMASANYVANRDGKVPKVTPLGRKAFIKRARRNISRTTSVDTLVEAIKASDLNHRNKRNAMFLLRQENTKRACKRLRKRLENTLAQPKAMTYVSRDTVNRLIREHFLISLGNRFGLQRPPR
jgi:hypothetical protein